MTKEEAHQILDRVRAGKDEPLALIDAALEATGDKEEGAPVRIFRRKWTPSEIKAREWHEVLQ